jgi:nucleotide-binding universal stress UspA family protein
MYKRILLAYDGSPSGQKALLDCQDLAQWSQAELALVAVLPLNIGLVAMEGSAPCSVLVAITK